MRGRIARGEYVNKSRVLSTRIREDTRKALESAAAKSKRSLSQEIEFRLRRTLADDIDVSNRFGTRQNYAVLRMISCFMDFYSASGAGTVSWLDDPFLFEKTKRSINHALEAVRPPGEIKGPEGFDWISADDLALVQSGRDAAVFLSAVKYAEPPDPAAKRDDDHPISNAPFIKADLGDRTDRIGSGEETFGAGTASDYRQRAAEMDRKAASAPRRQRKAKGGTSR
jgi:hypothetical protein